jgi:hypothetical protein
VEQAIDTATANFAAVDPPLRAFYAALPRSTRRCVRSTPHLTMSRRRGFYAT